MTCSCPRGYSLGAVDFISTPIDPDVLRTKVGVFVDLYQKTETIRQQAAHRVQLAREQAARQVAEKAMRRSALLAEASRLLSRSLDFDTTLSSLHRTVVPALADAANWCWTTRTVASGLHRCRIENERRWQRQLEFACADGRWFQRRLPHRSVRRSKAATRSRCRSSRSPSA